LTSFEADHLNTPRLISDQAGNTVWRNDNTEPFGDAPPNNNPSGLGAFEFNLRFPGQYFDWKTNLAYNMARNYDPAIARYIESDPIDLKGGVNTYAYVRGNPPSYTDSKGLLVDAPPAEPPVKQPPVAPPPTGLGGAGSVASAKLRLNAAASANASVGMTVYAVSNTTWSESTLTWNNKPARGGALGSTTVTGNSFIYYELDVSNYLIAEKAAGRNIVSFALHNPAASNQTIWIHSREATSSRPQLVITPNVAPTVALTSPTAGAVFQTPATITLTANAADTDGTVAKVDFFDGATQVGTATAAPYGVTLANVAAGTHTYTARATDTLGASTTSGAVTIKVNAAPTVSLTSPANGASFTAPATIPLAASATDGDGTITKVEFFQGATLIATVTTAPYNFTWTNVAQGSYTLTAKATDNDGAMTTSAAVTITVKSGVAQIYYIQPDHLNTPRLICRRHGYDGVAVGSR